MKTIDEILDENIDVVNELVEAAFRQGYGTLELGPVIGMAVSRYATKAIYARTQANVSMYNAGIWPKPIPVDDGK